jgi:peroxiredoxin
MSLEGEQAPEFSLETTAGDEASLSDAVGDGPAVVLVNRVHWCSFCAEQLQTFSEVEYDLWFNDVHETRSAS